MGPAEGSLLLRSRGRPWRREHRVSLTHAYRGADNAYVDTLGGTDLLELKYRSGHLSLLNQCYCEGLVRDKSSILVDLELVPARLRKLNIHVPDEVELGKPVSDNDRPG